MLQMNLIFRFRCRRSDSSQNTYVTLGNIHFRDFLFMLSDLYTVCMYIYLGKRIF
jgi:hypothetical protein